MAEPCSTEELPGGRGQAGTTRRSYFDLKREKCHNIGRHPKFPVTAANLQLKHC